MNSWAKVGDLVFVLGKNNEPVPCKVIKELGTGPSAQLFFEPIEDKDKGKIPRSRLKCFIKNAGYRGGFVFREKQNALDYLEIIKNKGSFDMTSMISKKISNTTQRVQEYNDIQKIKEQAAQEAVDSATKGIIAAMLIALNNELGIGPKRGAKIINDINDLLNGSLTYEELVNFVETKWKIKL